MSNCGGGANLECFFWEEVASHRQACLFNMLRLWFSWGVANQGMDDCNDLVSKDQGDSRAIGGGGGRNCKISDTNAL